MNIKKYILLILFIVVGVFALLAFANVNKINHPVLNNSIQESNSPTPAVVATELQKTVLEAKTDTQGAVTVEVMPIELPQNVSEWKFKIILNTHSLELTQDMTQVVVLVGEQGKEYKPIRWEGAEPGGHHREGILIFKSIIPMPKSIELKILGIDALVRSFIWSITN